MTLSWEPERKEAADFRAQSAALFCPAFNSNPVNLDLRSSAHYDKIKRARQGEEIIIIEAGRPVARLVPLDKPIAPRVPGSAVGQVVIADDFDTPLPESILRAFEQ
jgi:antitoxin (DNA-binding transcriptional repressor) of toxin-antitoxin stability system